MIDKLKGLFRDGSFRPWLGLSALLFVVGIIISILPLESLRNLFVGQIAGLRELASVHPPYSLSTFIFILFKNAVSLIVSFTLSPLLGIVPLISLFANGWLLGYVAVLTTNQKSLLFLLLGILPHGIFEIPAFFIGEAAALNFGTAVIIAVFKHEKRAELSQNIRQNMLRLAVAMALLVPAALIETYITPRLIG